MTGIATNGPEAEKGRERAGGRLEDHVFGKLLEAIRSGAYSLGDRLPSEMELAQEYGVSRPVLRGALARVREEGLIVSRQGAGSFVSSGVQAGGGGFGPLESVDDIAAYFSYRRMLEAETAALAATRATAADVAELRGYMADMAALVEVGTATIDPDLLFHTKIAKLSDNRFLVDSVAMLRPHMVFIGRFVRSLGSTGYARGKEAMTGEHEDIVRALEAGDAEAARAAMVAHIDRSQRRVFKGEGSWD